MRKISIRINKDDLFELDVLSKVYKVERSSLVQKILNEYLDKHADAKRIKANYMKEMELIELQLKIIESEKNEQNA